MAWDPIGNDEYSGDTPMDAFGGALSKAAAECEAKLGRLPRTQEIVEAFADVLASAPAGTVRDPEKAEARLANIRRAVANARPTPKRQRAKTGDVLAIPYAGAKEIYGWVLFAPARGERSEFGVCVVVLDRDVRPGDDLAEVVRSKVVLGPVHPNDREICEGLWRIVGNAAGDFDALLPRFETTVPRNGKMVKILRDHLGKEVEGTPENRARVCSPSVGGARWLMCAARALRGEGRWLAACDAMLPPGEKRP